VSRHSRSSQVNCCLQGNALIELFRSVYPLRQVAEKPASRTGGVAFPMKCLNIIGKFDGSGVSGSTGRGRSQALESKVRFADHPDFDAEM
jgi:hypothetical protein